MCPKNKIQIKLFLISQLKRIKERFDTNKRKVLYELTKHLIRINKLIRINEFDMNKRIGYE